jgi:hypothetical protein
MGYAPRPPASRLGRELVEEERALDRLFASRTVTPEALRRSLARIATLYGELRQTHLEAHLAQTALLTPEQIETYRRLRNYAGGTPETHERRRH